MRKLSLGFFIICIFQGSLFAQPVNDSIYSKRLYYLCKVWGHAKYYHTEIAKGNINWDDELLRSINGAKYAPSDQAFNDSLLIMLTNAGEMEISTTPLPEVPDSLNNNIELDWIHDSFLSDDVSSVLDTIHARFRPQSNVYLGVALPGINHTPTFDNDQEYYNTAQYPSEELRILALFRYWNIINYFYPYKFLMDQDWDTSLVEFLPLIINASDALDYHLTFKQLASRNNDAHGKISSTTYYIWSGSYYPPFLVQTVEGEMVVTKVNYSQSGISVGDVIRKIDGIDISLLRDSIRPYAKGANDIGIEHDINQEIMWGDNGDFTVTLDDGNNIHTETCKRDGSNYFELFHGLNNNYAWKDTIIQDSCHFGIVNMAMLDEYHVDEMFDDLWDTQAIIFDVRNYPHPIIWQIVDYLYQSPFHIANFAVPDTMYPGRLYWHQEVFGNGTSNPYQGEIIILFNEWTISMAEYTCMGLDQFPNAIKIGSTTAGSDGDATPIYLPGNIQAYFTGLGCYYPDYRQTQRVGIIPHYEMRPTIEGLREGRDELMEFALNCTLFGITEHTQSSKIKAYPNPFTTSTTIGFTLDGNSKIQISIYNTFGQPLYQFEDQFEQGSHTVTWSPSHLPEGLYYAVLRSGEGVSVVKMVKQ